MRVIIKGMDTCIIVQAIMLDRPLLKSFKSKDLPSLGLSSIPIYKSYSIDPGILLMPYCQIIRRTILPLNLRSPS